MAVNFCNHFFHPFSESGIVLSKREKRISRLCLLFIPLFIFPSLGLFYGLTYYFKKRALKNLTGCPTPTDLYIKRVAGEKLEEVGNPVILTPFENESSTKVRDVEIESSSSEEKEFEASEPDVEKLLQDSQSYEEIWGGDFVRGNYPNAIDYGDLQVPSSVEEAVDLVLNTPGFDTPNHQAKNYYNPLNRQDTVEEIQGTSELRRMVRFASSHFVNVLDGNSLRTSQFFTSEQCLIFKIKRVSHVFDLKGRIDLPSGKSLNLEGFCEDFTIPMVASSFSKFFEISCKAAPSLIPQWLTSEGATWIQRHLLGVLTSDITTDDSLQRTAEILQNPSFSGLVAFGSGFDWHSTITGFVGNLAFICNRGQHCKISGIAFYGLNERAVITDTAIRDICKRQNVQDKDLFGHNAMINELGAKHLFNQKMSMQKVGNCTYRSVEAFLMTLLALQYLRHQSDARAFNKLDGNIMINAFNCVQETFTHWINHDRKDVLDGLQAEREEQEGHENNNGMQGLLGSLEGQVISSETYQEMVNHILFTPCART
ncbi:hypothetical protein PHSC3_002017 [Chlamydiales bacterium STE3]|nr:hypothetical protein PHSC3_002017 [Chlamydiales bacterium STE3]